MRVCTEFECWSYFMLDIKTFHQHKDGQGKGLVFNFQLSISFINKKNQKKSLQAI